MKHLFLFLFLLPGILAAQVSKDTDTVSIKYDTHSTVSEKAFSEENLAKKYTGDEFDYEVTTGQSQNLLLRFLNWLSRKLNNTFGIQLSPNTLEFLQYTIYVLMGLLVLYLLVRFIVNENFGSIFTKKANPILDIDLAEEHIEDLDLDALLRDALKQKDYRLAVRFQFLKVLKSLSQRQIIDWHFEKTNSDYSREINENRLKTGFDEASYLYENIWYGEQWIDANLYEKTQHRFSRLHQMIA
ncbi:MAG: hypothetical protein AAGL29_07420 [Bacteroidota bacterium]